MASSMGEPSEMIPEVHHNGNLRCSGNGGANGRISGERIARIITSGDHSMCPEDHIGPAKGNTLQKLIGHHDQEQEPKTVCTCPK